MTLNRGYTMRRPDGALNTARGFPPVATPDARVLVLGSMPGEISLKAQQYYANPRNAFWHIMEALFGLDAEGPYEERLESLLRNRIALWDVLEACHRRGSLDASIDEDSIVANDFVSFYGRHRTIRAIFFNGSKAEQAYRKYVLPELPENMRTQFMHRLPSTSPANARLPLPAKAEKWRVIYDYIHET